MNKWKNATIEETEFSKTTKIQKISLLKKRIVLQSLSGSKALSRS